MPSVSTSNIIEFIPDRLYLTWVVLPPQANSQVHYFTIDNEFVYTSFHADFGPNNIAQVLLFVRLVNRLLEAPVLKNKKICLFTHIDDKKRVNSAFLLSAFMMLSQNQTPEKASYMLMGIQPPLSLYRDAGQGPATFFLTILDCLRGLKKAMDFNLINLGNFEIQDYLYREKVENGDMNWIVPGKFLAFAGPDDEVYEKHAMIAFARGTPPFRFPQLLEHFKRINIRCVIRLNNKTYDRRRFLEAGIDHVDLYFADGTNPPDAILYKFLEIVESRPGPFAIHCKAGLGRTGTLIACFLMKHFQFTANEVIGYIRLMRPGSVVGPQQQYLCSMEQKMWQMGISQRNNTEVDINSRRIHSATQKDNPRTQTSDFIPVQPNKREIFYSNLPEDLRVLAPSMSLPPSTPYAKVNIAPPQVAPLLPPRTAQPRHLQRNAKTNAMSNYEYSSSGSNSSLNPRSTRTRNSVANHTGYRNDFKSNVPDASNLVAYGKSVTKSSSRERM